jgi:hypothetical protein
MAILWCGLTVKKTDELHLYRLVIKEKHLICFPHNIRWLASLTPLEDESQINYGWRLNKCRTQLYFYIVRTKLSCWPSCNLWSFTSSYRCFLSNLPVCVGSCPSIFSYHMIYNFSIGRYLRSCPEATVCKNEMDWRFVHISLTRQRMDTSNTF